MQRNQSVSDDFKNRIAKVIELLGGPGKACKAIGVSYTTLNRWKSGKAEPSRSNLVSMAIKAQVSIEWLAMGEFQQMASEEPYSNEQPTAQSHKINPYDGDYLFIPALDIEITGQFLISDDKITTVKQKLAFQREWIQQHNLNPNSLIAFFTHGDSMAPTIPEGASILIDKTRNQALDGKVYVIRIANRFYIKRVQWLLDGGLRLISDNKMYPAQDITLEKMNGSTFEIYGRVIRVCYDLPD